ncbi:MAG: porin family protein [Bacteroidales bacterium]
MSVLKKRVLILVGLLSLTVYTFSQPLVGFQAGINMSGLRGHKTYDDKNPRFGLNGYLFVDIPFSKNSIVSLETGLSYSPQGNIHTTSTKDLAATDELKVHQKLNYIIVPLYLKENYSGFYTKIGPYAGYLIGAESTWKNTKTEPGKDPVVTSGTYENYKEEISKYDIGISVGFGFIHYFDPTIYRNKRHRNRRTPVMQVDFKYNIGLTTIDATGNNSELSLKNQVFTIGISITSVNN